MFSSIERQNENKNDVPDQKVSMVQPPPLSRDLYPYEIIRDDEKYHKLNEYSEIKSQLQTIRRLHLDSVHYEALEHINTLSNYIKSNHPDLLDLFNKHPRVIRVKQDISQTNKMLLFMSSNNKNWTLIKDDGTWKTEYIHTDKSAYHSFKLSGVGNVKLLNILALFYEMQLISKWMPLAKESGQIAQLSLFCKCGFVRIGALWPIADREVVVFGFGVDDLKQNGKLLVYFDTDNNGKHSEILKAANIQIPKCQKNRVRVDLSLGGFLFETVKNDPNKTKMTVVWNADPKMNVPATIMNWFTGQFAGIFLSRIVNTAKSVDKDPDYIQSMAKNSEFYETMKKKIDQNTNCITKI